MVMHRPRNMGRFKVDSVFFENMRPGEGVNLFHGMIVLDVRYDLGDDSREYVAVHASFRDVPLGELIPEYNAIFYYHLGATSLPEWREVPPPERFTHEEVSAAIAARLRRDSGLRNTPDSADAFAYAASGFNKQRQRERLVDIQRTGWRGGLDRLLQRWSTLVRAVLGRRDTAAGNDVSEGRQQIRAGAVGSGHGGFEHDAYGDGMLGQSSWRDEGGAIAAAAQAAGVGSDPSTRYGAAVGYGALGKEDRRDESGDRQARRSGSGEEARQQEGRNRPEQKRRL